MSSEQQLDRIRAFYEAAAGWWGESWYDGENLQARLDLVERYGFADTGRRQAEEILELGAGTGETAAFLCDHGYSVVAVELCRRNIELLQRFQRTRPALRVMEGDYLTIGLDGRFPVVCVFEAFGLGSDRDQRSLLRRISREWLAPGGIAILDVYHPYGPIRDAGTARRLDRLGNVPGSVDMTEYCRYDGIHNRWIDIWEPVHDKAAAQTQSIRCYTPDDLRLLLEGTGLGIETLLFRGRTVDLDPEGSGSVNPFENADNQYSYVAILRKRPDKTPDSVT